VSDVTLTPYEARILAHLVDADPVFQTTAEIARATRERPDVVHSALGYLRRRDLVTVGRRGGTKVPYACTTLGAAEITQPVRRSIA
jgi:hypothetical protein